MSDFSWPVFYRLTIKNEKDLPRKVIPGRRLRINLTLINELDMFRGDDILAECPIPLRVVAIPIEDNSTIDKNGRVINHHEISCETQTKNLRIKPLIERNGQGTIIIDLSPSPVLRHDEELMFILQIGISPSSRIFNHVIPVSTSPFIMVSPHSIYAKENLRRTNDEEEEDEETDGSDDDHDDVIDLQAHLGLDHDHPHHNHGDHCSGHHHHHHNDAQIGPEEALAHQDGLEDEDGDEDMYDEDDFDEDFDEDEDGEEHGEAGLAVFANDEDLYEDPTKPFEWEDPEDMETNLGELPGIYHAFVCDPLLSAPLHPNLLLLADSFAKTNQILPLSTLQADMQHNQQQNTPTDPATTSAPPQSAPASTATPINTAKPVINSTTTNTVRGLQIQGVVRKPKALPPALAAKQAAQTAAIVAQQESRTKSVADTMGSYKFPVVGLKKQGEGAFMFQTPRYSTLDALNGLFAINTAHTASTLQLRHTIAMSSYAYVKVIQGLSIGGRIWDGAVYLMKFLQRLLGQTQNILDGVRILELGSGTGVLGIWIYQLVLQRTIAQLTQLCSRFQVKRVEVEAVLDLLCNGDFSSCAQQFLGLSEEDAKSSSIFSVTVPTPVYSVAVLMKEYTATQPTMILTDQPKIMSLLEHNARLNTTAKFPLYNSRLIPGSLTIIENSQTKSTTIKVANQSIPYTQLPFPVTPVTGLHALTCDWNAPLNKHIFKAAGVYIPSSTASLYTAPPSTLNKTALDVKLPPNIESSNIQFTPAFETLTDLSSPLYADLRQNVSTLYHHYESLENAISSPGRAQTGLEELLVASQGLQPPPAAQAASPTQLVPKYVNLHGLDLIFAVECLYNDRYFDALKSTLVNLYQAQMFAYAQKLYLHTATQSPSSLAPKLQLPLVVLSYRYRATHEEELIKKHFFEALRPFGLYHTELPLFRVLGESTIHQETSGSVNTLSAQVQQRNKERKERENAIRNCIGELDMERQHHTRLAIIYWTPGVIIPDNAEKEAPQDPEACPRDGEDVQVLSPVPYLSPNAVFWYQLFQKM